MCWFDIKWSQWPGACVWAFRDVGRGGCVFIPSLAQGWAVQAAPPAHSFQVRMRIETACSDTMVADWWIWLGFIWAVTITGTVPVAMEQQGPRSNVTKPMGRAWSVWEHWGTPSSRQCFVRRCCGSVCVGLGEIWWRYCSCSIQPCFLEM